MRDQKRDGNERPIMDALSATGCSIDQLPGGNGRPDLLVGDPVTGLGILMEVKQPDKAKLNPLQKKYHTACKARIHLVTSPEVALEVLTHYRRKYT